MWVLGTQPGSSEIATSALDGGIISPTLYCSLWNVLFIKIYLFGVCVCVCMCMFQGYSLGCLDWWQSPYPVSHLSGSVALVIADLCICLFALVIFKILQLIFISKDPSLSCTVFWCPFLFILLDVHLVLQMSELLVFNFCPESNLKTFWLIFLQNVLFYFLSSSKDHSDRSWTMTLKGHCTALKKG